MTWFKKNIIWFSYIALMFAGLLWGAREKVHQNPAVFQKAFPGLVKEDVSFFGKDMWKMKYVDYDEGNRQYRNELIRYFPYNDFWHSSWYLIVLLRLVGIYWAMRSKSFWNFNKFYLLLLWVFIIPAFWGGVSFWYLSTLL